MREVRKAQGEVMVSTWANFYAVHARRSKWGWAWSLTFCGRDCVATGRARTKDLAMAEGRAAKKKHLTEYAASN